jgi:Na+-translocating ferredoxin:NAD+ oxidoreductase subunit G
MKTLPILIAGLVLGAFAIVGVALVAVTHAATAERIATNDRMTMLKKLEAIVPAGSIGNDPIADRIEVQNRDLLGGASTNVYRVRKDGQPVAVVLNPVVPDGYAGPIKLLVAVMKDGSLGGVRVVSHHETPGLGDRIEEQRSNWILAFTGKSIGNPAESQWKVKRDGGVFDQFTGATISPRSIVKAVANTLRFVQSQGEQLYTQPALPAAKGAS